VLAAERGLAARERGRGGAARDKERARGIAVEAVRETQAHARPVLDGDAAAAPAARPARACAACGAAARPVGGRLLVCGSCKATYFCSADCQRRAWPAHMESCRAARGG
jgi:hypothetical protein